MVVHATSYMSRDVVILQKEFGMIIRCFHEVWMIRICLFFSALRIHIKTTNPFTEMRPHTCKEGNHASLVPADTNPCKSAGLRETNCLLLEPKVPILTHKSRDHADIFLHPSSCVVLVLDSTPEESLQVCFFCLFLSQKKCLEF